MSKVFTKTYVPRYSEINADGLLDPADCVRYIIDTAYEWGESLGLGFKASEELGLFWVVRENEIHLFDSLHFMEEFDFTIWMYEWKRVRGIRCFEMKRKSDNRLIAQGTQKLVCLDIETQRLVTPPEELLKNFRLENPREIPSQRFPKVSINPDEALTFQQKVTWQDVDMLEIVNNAVYISYAEEAARQTFIVNGLLKSGVNSRKRKLLIRHVQIKYLSPAEWNDILDMTTFPLSQDKTKGSLYIGMTRQAGGEPIAECILDWELVE
jgi:YbgC/YbaW family acyl-CoA thioester hydrolase